MQKLLTLKRARFEVAECSGCLNINSTDLQRPSGGKELAVLKQLFHCSDGHGAVGLLVATGRKDDKLR